MNPPLLFTPINASAAKDLTFRHRYAPQQWLTTQCCQQWDSERGLLSVDFHSFNYSIPFSPPFMGRKLATATYLPSADVAAVPLRSQSPCPAAADFMPSKKQPCMRLWENFGMTVCSFVFVSIDVWGGERRKGRRRRPSKPLVTPRASFMFLHEPLRAARVANSSRTMGPRAHIGLVFFFLPFINLGLVGAFLRFAWSQETQEVCDL